MRLSIPRLTVRRFVAVAFLLLALMFALQITSSLNDSQTVDEGAHLAAGYSYWKTGDFRLNPEHPPLLKLIASVPLLALPIHMPTNMDAWREGNQWSFARELLYHNSVSADTILFWGRLLPMMLGLALATFVSFWSWHLWGAKGALVSLILFAFDPTVLAHSRYVTNDVAVSLFFVLTIYLFGKYLATPHWKTAIPVWIVFALAQLTKFSALILVPILVILWVAVFAFHRAQRNFFGFRTVACFFAGMFATTFLLVFAAYGFETKRPIDDPHVAQVYATKELWQRERYPNLPKSIAAIQQFSDPSTPTGQWLSRVFTTVRIPTYSYLRGLSDVIWHNYWGHDSYLLGKYGFSGWWWYFPFAFLVKTPPVTIAFILLSCILFVYLFWKRFNAYAKHSRSPNARLYSALSSVEPSYFLLFIPPLVYLFFSMTSHINLGVRHLLPMFPFLCVLCGGITRARFRSTHISRIWNISIITLLLAFLASVSFIYPHYLAYFSEFVGGADKGARYLTDSNLDWGQELKRLGMFMRERNIPFVYMTYFGQAPMDYYLPDVRYLPASTETEKIESLNGWAAISATALYDKDQRYSWLLQRHPTVKIGYAIFLYDLRK